MVVLPLLYCPMTWGMYHIFFQLLGDFWMLLGLLVMAFGPMVCPGSTELPSPGRHQKVCIWMLGTSVMSGGVRKLE